MQTGEPFDGEMRDSRILGSGDFVGQILCPLFVIDLNKQIVYATHMITTFANKETEKLFTTGRSKKLPSEIITRSIMRLTQLDNAREVTDLLIPPSNHLETLSGDRAGQWSIRINDQWRICFLFANGEATYVEITDYH